MEYKIKSVQRRDEWNSQYGHFQDYAVAFEGVEGWIKLTQKFETAPPQEGSTLFGRIETKRNKNGTEYQKFVKEQRQGGGAGVAPEKLDYIIQMLEELTGRRAAPDIQMGSPETPASEPDPFEGLGV